MTDPSPPSGDSGQPPRPAAPVPHARPLSWLAAVRALLDNPLTSLSVRAFEERILPPGRVTGMRLVSDPLAIEHVLIGNAANYRKSPDQSRVLDPVLGPGLITAEGAIWRAARAGVAPAFTPRAVAARADGILACARGMAERWQTAGPRPCDLAAEMLDLSYDIASRTLFAGALDDGRSETRRAIARCLDTLGRLDLATLLRLPPAFSLPARLRARSARQVLRRLVARALSTRLAHPRHGEPDLLDRLIATATEGRGRIGPDLDAIGTGILTFLVAGHETTGNALAWTFYLLALFPEHRDRMRAELASADTAGPPAPDALPFCRAVIAETLRLYPTVPFIGREAIDADWLEDVRIPAGGRVMISPWVVHRHRQLWEAPDLFRPERFLGGARIRRGSYLPFGLGPRICIGQGFALQEILLVLSVLVPQFDVDLVAPGQVMPEARITLRPRNGLPMRIRPRIG